MSLATVVKEAQESPQVLATCHETGLVAITNKEGETSVGLVGDAAWMYIPLTDFLTGECVGMRAGALQRAVINRLLSRWAGKTKEGANND